MTMNDRLMIGVAVTLSLAFANNLSWAETASGDDDSTTQATEILDAAGLLAPVRLRADGEAIDTGRAYESGGEIFQNRTGHSGPCIHDFDGDGLDDLILGDFSGRFRVYRNVGDANKPSYVGQGPVQAGGEDARVPISCCIASQARFGDLNGDGIDDMIANSYNPGCCYVFWGQPDRQFAARQELKDKDGTPIVLTNKSSLGPFSLGSCYELVDWEGDGDLDLLVGSFFGWLAVRINEGTKTEPRFVTEDEAISVKAGDRSMTVSGHFCPKVADWDGDGRWDILAGSVDGSVTFFRNTGAADAPFFASGQVIVAPHDGNGYQYAYFDESMIVPGVRSQIDVMDFNGDGELDLLLGDFYTAYAFKPDLSQQQVREVKMLMDQTEKAIAESKYRQMRKAIDDEFEESMARDPEKSEQWTKIRQDKEKALAEGPELKELDRMIDEATKSMIPYTTKDPARVDDEYDLFDWHGHVWLYQRQNDDDPQTNSPAAVPEKPATQDDQVSATIRITPESVQPGHNVEVSVTLDVAAGFEIHALHQDEHTSKHPFPTRLELNLPSGLTAAEPWKAPTAVPSRHPAGGSVYQSEVTFTRTIRITPETSAGNLLVPCSVSYQACNTKLCLRPIDTELSAALTVVP